MGMPLKDSCVFVIETNIGKVFHFSLVLSLLKNYSFMTGVVYVQSDLWRNLGTQPTFSDLRSLGTVSCVCWQLVNGKFG